MAPIDHTHAKKKKKKINYRYNLFQVFQVSTIGLFELVGDTGFPLKTLFKVF